MAVSPITPQMPDIKGEPITVAITYTSTNANVETITLPTYMPKIDLSRAHPVLNIFLLITEDTVGVETPSVSLIFPSTYETDRGTTPTAAGAGTGFEVVTDSTLEVWDGALDLDGIAFVTYIPAGVQNA